MKARVSERKRLPIHSIIVILGMIDIMTINPSSPSYPSHFITHIMTINATHIVTDIMTINPTPIVTDITTVNPTHIIGLVKARDDTTLPPVAWRATQCVRESADRSAVIAVR
jgi:hypothetical protein